MASEKERSTAIGLQAEGKVEETEIHFGAARHFDDKARYARQKRGNPPVVMGGGQRPRRDRVAAQEHPP